MRKMSITLECNEKILGALIADMTEKKDVTIRDVKVIVEDVPNNLNARRRAGAGVSGMEIVKKLKGPFEKADITAAFVKAGLSPNTVPTFLMKLKNQKLIKKVGKSDTHKGFKYAFITGKQ